MKTNQQHRYESIEALSIGQSSFSTGLLTSGCALLCELSTKGDNTQFARKTAAFPFSHRPAGPTQHPIIVNRGRQTSILKFN
jgi:hypothetical protein